jgi:hypothetical protein
MSDKNNYGEITLSMVSVAEAKKIIGPDAKFMSDEELLDSICGLTSIVRAFLRNVPKYN